MSNSCFLNSTVLSIVILDCSDSITYLEPIIPWYFWVPNITCVDSLGWTFASKFNQLLMFSAGFQVIFSVYIYPALIPSLHQVQCHMLSRVRIWVFFSLSYIMIPCSVCVWNHTVQQMLLEVYTSAIDHGAKTVFCSRIKGQPTF